MSAFENREVAQCHVAAILQRDRLVAGARHQGRRPSADRVDVAAKAPSPDQPRTNDRDIIDAVAVDQAVVEMAVPKVLVAVPRVGFGRVIAARRRRQDRRPAFEPKRDACLLLHI